MMTMRKILEEDEERRHQAHVAQIRRVPCETCGKMGYVEGNVFSLTQSTYRARCAACGASVTFIENDRMTTEHSSEFPQRTPHGCPTIYMVPGIRLLKEPIQSF